MNIIEWWMNVKLSSDRTGFACADNNWYLRVNGLLIALSYGNFELLQIEVDQIALAYE